MGTCDSDLSALASGRLSAMTHENVLESSHCRSCYGKAINLHKLPQFKSLTGDRLVNSDILNLLSKTPVPKGVMSRCHGVPVSRDIIFWRVERALRDAAVRKWMICILSVYHKPSGADALSAGPSALQ